MKAYNEKLHASHCKKYCFNHLEVEDHEELGDSDDRGCAHEILATLLDLVNAPWIIWSLDQSPVVWLNPE